GTLHCTAEVGASLEGVVDRVVLHQLLVQVVVGLHPGADGGNAVLGRVLAEVCRVREERLHHVVPHLLGDAVASVAGVHRLDDDRVDLFHLSHFLYLANLAASAVIGQPSAQAGMELIRSWNSSRDPSFLGTSQTSSSWTDMMVR